MIRKILTIINLRRKVLFSFFFILPLTSPFARLRNFETTLLKSTAGTGVGGFFMDEATVLNPAPLAFFKNGAIFFQKSGNKVSDSSAQSLTYPKGDQTAYIISDSGGSLNGSLSYLKYNESYDERSSLNFSLAHLLGQQSSMGITYHKTKDTFNINSSPSIVKYDHITIGFTHVLNKDVSMGLIVTDPFKKRIDETRAIIGVQYSYKNMLGLMLDAGSDYNRNLSQTFLYRAAIQTKIFSDLFLRFGLFDDKGKKERGNGAGIGWIQPRLAINLAIKNTTIGNNDLLGIISSELKESSFSLSYKF